MRNESSIPFQITFRDFESSESVWLAIEDRIEKLERFKSRATNCEVIVSKPHRHNSHGQIYHVEIRLRVPGHNIFINRERERNEAHTDVFITIRDAFDALERRLEDFVRVRRGNVKNHENNFLEEKSHEQY